MFLQVIGSSSAGNCYILQGANEALVIECGMPLMDAKRVTGYKISKIVGAIVSHKHGDHSKYADQYLDSAIDVYAGDTYQGKNGRCSKPITNGVQFQLGEFTVKPLEVEHDVECFSFLINHPKCGRVYFVTDTHYCKYKPKGLNQIIIECNYGESILEHNVTEGHIEPLVRNRVLTSHMSVETVSKWLKAVDLSKVRNIVLTHLSSANAHGETFTKEIEKATGKLVHVARPKLSIPFNKTSF